MPIDDTLARHIVTKIVDRNVFTPAGAGSGKTTSLVDRLVTLIKSGVDVSKICTITFTKAAANEFYVRFQKKLVNEEKILKDEIIKKRAQNALKDIDKCFMGTIDAFCQQILKENFFKSIVSSTFEVSDDDTKIAAFNKIFDDMLSSNYGEEARKKVNTLVDIYSSNARLLFVDALNTLIEYKDYNLGHYNIASEKDILTLETKYKTNLKMMMDEYYIHKDALKRGKNDALSEDQKGFVDKYKTNIKDFDSWSNNLLNVRDLLKTYSSAGLPSSTKKESNVSKIIKYWDDENEVEAFISQYEDDVITINEKILPIINARLFDVIIDATWPYLDIISKELNEKQKIITFSDAVNYVYKMIKEDASNNGEIIKRIRNKYSYFLLDEAQDTKPITSEIFFMLSTNKPNPDWRKCIPEPGSLFIVGDAKQSIYRFQGADVKSFNAVGEVFKEDESALNIKAKLTKNFRSTPELLQYFNDTFSKLIRSEDNPFQSDYDMIANAFDPSNKGSQIYDDDNNLISNPIFTYDIEGKKDDPEKVIRCIKSIINNDKFKIKTKDDATYRKVEYKDIMIITSGKGNLASYGKVLSSNNIPYFIEGNNSYNDSEAFVSLTYLLNAIINNNEVNLYKVLTSSLFNVNDEIISILSINKLLDLNADKNQLINYPYINKIYDEINRFKQISYNISSASLIERIISEFDLFNNTKLIASDFVYSALEQIKAKEADGNISSLNDTVTLLNNLLNKTQERILRINESANAIHIANLHKVKGLEAPICILAYSLTNSRGSSSFIDNDTKTITPLYFQMKDYNSSSSNFSSIKAEGVEEAINLDLLAKDAEIKRLLYVAATRAKNVLIISNVIGRNRNKNYWKDLITSNNPLKLIDNELVMSDFEAPSYEVFDKANNSNIETYKIIKPSEVHSNHKIALEDLEDTITPVLSLIKKDLKATVVGTITHKLMEVLVNSNFKCDINNLVIDTLNLEGVDLKYKDGFINVCKTMLSGGYKQEDGNNDLFKELKDAKCYCEVPFAFKDDDNIINGVIDLIYVKDNKYYIVDYKTDKEMTNLNKRHIDQLKLYEKALKETLNVDSTSRIYRIDI